MEDSEIPMNEWFVGSPMDQNAAVSIGRMACDNLGSITKKQAISLAAWLAVLADPLGDDFDAALNAIRNS